MLLTEIPFVWETMGLSHRLHGIPNAGEKLGKEGGRFFRPMAAALEFPVVQKLASVGTTNAERLPGL